MRDSSLIVCISKSIQYLKSKVKTKYTKIVHSTGNVTLAKIHAKVVQWNFVVKETQFEK